MSPPRRGSAAATGAAVRHTQGMMVWGGSLFGQALTRGGGGCMFFRSFYAELPAVESIY